MQSHPTQPLSYATVIILTVLHKYAQIDFSKFVTSLILFFCHLLKVLVDYQFEINSALMLFIKLSTAQKMKFSIKDFSSKCDQIRRKLQFWSDLLEKSLMENFIFCAVKLGS